VAEGEDRRLEGVGREWYGHERNLLARPPDRQSVRP
jgi:hypothetical protein